MLDNLRCENMIMGKMSKVVVCGTKKCGKTSLLEQIIYGKVGVSNIIEIYSDKSFQGKFYFVTTLDKTFILQISAFSTYY